MCVPDSLSFTAEVMMIIILNQQEDFHYIDLFFNMYRTESDLSLSITGILGIPFGVGDLFFFNHYPSVEKNIPTQ